MTYDLVHVRRKQLGELWFTDEINDLDLSPVIFNFYRSLEVVEVHVRAKLHWAECSGSWFIVLTEKKTQTKTLQSVATPRTVIKRIVFFQMNDVRSPVLLALNHFVYLSLKMSLYWIKFCFVDKLYTWQYLCHILYSTHRKSLYVLRNWS